MITPRTADRRRRAVPGDRDVRRDRPRSTTSTTTTGTPTPGRSSPSTSRTWRLVVPGQRPPVRQGADGHQHHRPGRQRGGQQRRAGVATHRGDGTTTFRWRAAEPMATTWRSSPPARSPSAAARPATACRGSTRSRSRAPSRSSATAQRMVARTPGYVSWLAEARRLPVRPDRRRGQAARRRLLAREADAAGVRVLRPPPLRPAARPRAGPPVVRRRGLGRALAGHLAQRGLRDLHAVGVRRGPRRPGRPQQLARRRASAPPGGRGLLGPAASATPAPTTCSPTRSTNAAR